MPTEATGQTPNLETLLSIGERGSTTQRAATVASALVQQPQAHFTNSIIELLQDDEMPGGTRRTGNAPAPQYMLQQEKEQLPDYSRQYQHLATQEIINSRKGSIGTVKSFFIPSYLRGTRYAERLEEAHRERAAKIKLQEGQSHSRNNSETIGRARSSSSLSGKTRFHHGVAHEIVEKPPVPLPSDPRPLPTKLNKDDKHKDLIYVNEYEVKFTASSNKTPSDKHEAYAIRADIPVPRQAGLYYYEVMVLTSNLHKSPLAIGFSSKTTPLTRPVGWEPDSWAYHGDDGMAYCCQTNGKKFSTDFGAEGDVIGCGVNFTSMTIFYTKNGVLLGNAFRDITDVPLYPSVGLKRPQEHVRVNFGQSPFIYDIDAHFEKEKNKIRTQIDQTSIAELAEPMNESDLIQSLVVQYLTHEGYLDTASAFVDEANKRNEAEVTNTDKRASTMTAPNPGNAKLRIGIRKAILEGDAENALELVRQSYLTKPPLGNRGFSPNSIRDTRGNMGMAYFKLRLQCLLEMFREHMRIRHLPTKDVGNGKPKDANGNQPWFDEVMKDVESLNNGGGNEDAASFMDIDASVGSLNGNGATNGKTNPAATEAMDEEEDEQDEINNLLNRPFPSNSDTQTIAEEDRQKILEALDMQMLQYSQELKREFGGHGDIVEVMLSKVYALFAFPEPEMVEHLGTLLSDEIRADAAESVNAAILVYHGKSPTAALELLVQQTTVLIDGMIDKSEAKGLQGNFVSVADYLKPNERPRRF